VNPEEWNKWVESNSATSSAHAAQKIRPFEHDECIQIAFTYKGAECRELVPPGPVTQTTVNLASGLRNEIRRRITESTFSEYFPVRPRAQQFDVGGSRVMLEVRLRLTEVSLRAPSGQRQDVAQHAGGLCQGDP
jgi:integrase